MNTETLIADIPHDLAQRAYSGTSFSPERRGDTARSDYASSLVADYELLLKQARKGGTEHLLEEEFARYRAGFRQRTIEHLGAESRCVSWFIAGPSKFPAARMQKRADSAHNKLNELLDFRRRALKSIIRKLRPELRPVMAGDSDAVGRLESQLADMLTQRERMKRVNSAHARFLKDPASLDTADLPEEWKARIRNYVPRYSWEPHPIAPYQLTNLGANIRRVEQRIEQLKRTKALPQQTVETESGIRVEDCPAENRVKIFFPGKPDSTVRDTLKSNGFRWTPTVGCWQAYRNYRSMALAQSYTKESQQAA